MYSLSNREMQALEEKTRVRDCTSQLHMPTKMLTSLEGDIAETYGLAPGRKYNPINTHSIAFSIRTAWRGSQIRHPATQNTSCRSYSLRVVQQVHRCRSSQRTKSGCHCYARLLVAKVIKVVKAIPSSRRCTGRGSLCIRRSKHPCWPILELPST